MKKIAVYGAGAVGCTLAAALMNNLSCQVTVVARSHTEEKIFKNGIKFNPHGKRVYLQCVSDPEKLGVHDIVILSTKAYNLTEIAPYVSKIIDESSIVLPICNGVPWWLCSHLSNPTIKRLNSLDPEGVLEQCLPTANLYGGLIRGAVYRESIDTIKIFYPLKLVVGTLDGKSSKKLDKLASILSEANILFQKSSNIKKDIWEKLSWNIAFNPLTAAYKKSCPDLLSDNNTRELIIAAMKEMEAIAKKLGLELELNIQYMLDIANSLGDFKTSMRVDKEQCRRIESEAIIDSVIEISQMLSINIPAIEQINQVFINSLT